MRQESAGRPEQPGPGVRRSMRAHRHREDAGAADTRQAWPVRLLLAAVLAGLAAGECRAADGAPAAVPDSGPAGTGGAADGGPAAEPAPPSTPPPADRQRQLLDEQRRVRGQLQTLDRQLAPYERERLRARPADPLTGPPPSSSRQDPVSERRELERRNLQFRQRQIESELRRSPGGSR